MNCTNETTTSNELQMTTTEAVIDCSKFDNRHYAELFRAVGMG